MVSCDSSGGLHLDWGEASWLTTKDASADQSIGRKLNIPYHAKSCRSWLTPINQEGLDKSYPRDLKEYTDYYPRKFTRIGLKYSVPNPSFDVFQQTLEYTNMKGEKRAAVTGSLKIGCLGLYFLDWVEPAKADITEKDMITFLSALRLESVTLPEDVRKLRCGPAEWTPPWPAPDK